MNRTTTIIIPEIVVNTTPSRRRRTMNDKFKTMMAGKAIRAINETDTEAEYNIVRQYYL
jgi:hypothetical protein